MSNGHKILKDDDSKTIDQTTYRSMIGKLQYVVHTRPDIALVVDMVARFSANPKKNHMMEIKKYHEISKRYSKLLFMVQNGRQFGLEGIY